MCSNSSSYEMDYVEDSPQKRAYRRLPEEVLFELNSGKATAHRRSRNQREDHKPGRQDPQYQQFHGQSRRSKV
jgi:hypothetical protein